MHEKPKDRIESDDRYKLPNTSIKIRGDVGPGSAVGTENTVEAYNIVGGNMSVVGSQGATKEDFFALLQQIQEKISQLQDQFRSDDVIDAQDALTKTMQMGHREEPPVERMKHNLDVVRDIVEETAKTGATIAPLLLLVQQAWANFSHLFGI